MAPTTIKCSTCERTLPPEFYGPEPRRNCRRCFFTKQRPGEAKRANVSLNDVSLMEAVTARQAMVKRLITARPCKRCQDPATEAYAKDGRQGAHFLMCEWLYPESFLRMHLSRLTALCATCALADWADEDAPKAKSTAAQLAFCKRMRQSWADKARRAREPGNQCQYYRAVYYWGERVRAMQDQQEREKAEALGEATEVQRPWFSFEGDEDFAAPSTEDVEAA